MRRRGRVGLYGYASMETAGAAAYTGEVVLGVDCDFYGVLGAVGAEEQLGQCLPNDLFFLLPSSSHGRVSFKRLRRGSA